MSTEAKRVGRRTCAPRRGRSGHGERDRTAFESTSRYTGADGFEWVHHLDLDDDGTAGLGQPTAVDLERPNVPERGL